MKKYFFCCGSPSMSSLDVLLGEPFEPFETGDSLEPFESTDSKKLILPEEDIELPDQIERKPEEKINYVIVISAPSTQTIILLFVLFFAYILQKETIGPANCR